MKSNEITCNDIDPNTVEKVETEGKPNLIAIFFFQFFSIFFFFFRIISEFESQRPLQKTFLLNKLPYPMKL